MVECPGIYKTYNKTMEITAKLVNGLRQKTGVSMMACKKALIEANGNEDKAIEILRKKGEAKAVEKSSRDAKEGAIQIYEENGQVASAIVYSETDFVARNDEFINLVKSIAKKALYTSGEEAREFADNRIKELFTKLGENMVLGEINVYKEGVIGTYVHSNNKLAAIVKLDSGDKETAIDIAMHVTAMDPKVIDPSEVSIELVNKEKEIWTEQLKKQGKPDNIIENILKGKEKKFREESALIKQKFVKDPDKTIESLLNGKKIESFVRFSI